MGLACHPVEMQEKSFLIHPLKCQHVEDAKIPTGTGNIETAIYSISWLQLENTFYDSTDMQTHVCCP